jgi:hypothetical protein
LFLPAEAATVKHLETSGSLIEGIPTRAPSKPLTEYSRRAKLWVPLIGWAVILAVIAVDYAVFSAFGVNYFRWYIDNGAIIALIFGLVTVVLDLNRLQQLISVHPGEYAGDLSFLLAEISWLFFALDDRFRADTFWYRSLGLDRFFNLIVLAIYVVAMAAYVVVVAPLQYWVNIVCGAPARIALSSPTKGVRVDENANSRLTRFPIEKPIDESTTHELGFRARPVSATAAIAAAVLWIVSQLV